MKFEYWQKRRTGKTKRARKQFYFHLRGDNGEIVIPSEGYNNVADCLAAISIVKKSNTADVVSLEPGHKGQAAAV